MARELDVATVRGWLLKRPRPQIINLTLADGEPKELQRAEGGSWQEVAESICALDPLLIEALDAKGKSLRAVKAHELANELRARDNERVAPPAALHTDPETARLCYMADLLHRAYQHATDVAFDKVTACYDTSFTKLVELVERIDQRSDALEKRLERTELRWRQEVNERLEERIEAAEAAAEAAKEGQGDLGSQILGSFMGGVGAGQSEAKPNGKGD